MKKFFSLKNVLLFILILFIILHITPQLSIRTHLFVTGHPKTAFTTQMNKTKHSSESKNVSFYNLTDPPTIKALDTDLTTYKVVRIFFLYFTVYHGNG